MAEHIYHDEVTIVVFLIRLPLKPLSNYIMQPYIHPQYATILFSPLHLYLRDTLHLYLRDTMHLYLRERYLDIVLI